MEKPWKIPRNLMLRCGNAGNRPNTPGSSEPFQGVHRTVPACPWNRSMLSMEFPWKVSDYPWKVVRLLRGFSVDFRKSPRKSYSRELLEALRQKGKFVENEQFLLLLQCFQQYSIIQLPYILGYKTLSTIRRSPYFDV